MWVINIYPRVKGGGKIIIMGKRFESMGKTKKIKSKFSTFPNKFRDSGISNTSLCSSQTQSICERNPNILSKSRFLESKSRFRTYSSTQSRFRTYCCCFFCLCSTTESVPLQTAFRSRKVLEDGCCGGHSTSCC